MLSLKQLARYPFCSEAKRLIEERKVSIASEGVMEKAKERVLNRVGEGGVKASIASEGVMEKAKERVLNRVGEGGGEGELIEEIASYGAAKVLLSIINRRSLINKYAVAEGKRLGELLRNEEDEGVVELVAGELGVRFEREGGRYRMGVFDYLRHAPRTIDYKLSNRSLERGWVRLSRAECIRVVSEALQRSIERSLPARVENAPEEARRAAKEIELLLPKEAPEVVEVKGGAYPPCMKRLLEQLEESENLPHNARFSLAAYLLNIGLSREKVVSLFRSAPDFDEKTTRYQVEFIARKGYKVPACSALDMQGICVADCRVGTPLRYRPGAERPWEGRR